MKHNRKIEVLHVGKFYYPYRGGMETYLANLCQELKEKVELKVLVSNTSRRTVREIVEGVEVLRAGRWGRLSATSFCPSFPIMLKQSAVDIIQIQHPDPLSGISYLIARPAGKLVIVYQSDIIRKRLIYAYYLLMNKFFRMADRIIVTSPQYLESSWFLKKFRNKCVIIPIGIDISLFQKSAGDEKASTIRKKYGEKIVLFVGRLARYKGVEYLIEAMTAVPAPLLIVGTGERKPALERLVEEKSLGDKVFFLGEVREENLVAFLHACSVFCLPSVTRNEAFGICQLEAMACGKPVVSTRLNTGVTYINQDGVTGLTVPPRDSRALAHALNRLLDSPDLRREFGRRGRMRVEELFTREKMAADTLRLYQEILGRSA